MRMCRRKATDIPPKTSLGADWGRGRRGEGNARRRAVVLVERTKRRERVVLERRGWRREKRARRSVIIDPSAKMEKWCSGRVSLIRIAAQMNWMAESTPLPRRYWYIDP